MDIELIRTKLRALANDDKRRPQTARLRDIYDEIEATLQAGVRWQHVLDELHQCGFTLQLASFKSAIQRIREEHDFVPLRSRRHRNPGPITGPANGLDLTGQERQINSDRPAAPAVMQAPSINATTLASKEQRERKADQYIPGPNLDHFRKAPS